MIDRLKRDRRLTALICVAIVLVIVSIVFYKQWQTAEGDDTDLEKTELISQLQLTAAIDLYESNQAEIDKLRTELESLKLEEASLSSRSEFPSEFPVVDLSNYLADGAPRVGVTISKVEPPQKTGIEYIGGTGYPTYETILSVTGELTEIISYLSYIEYGPFTSVKVKNVSLSEGKGGGDWTGVLNVVFIGQS